MKEPIKPEDIKRGDLIRQERPVGLRAIEYYADSDGHSWCGERHREHFLLDRPAPKVELPETPTLGWATTPARTVLVWTASERWSRAVDGLQPPVHRDDITAFAEAVAVPKAALDELRTHGSNSVCTLFGGFLDAVDEANS